MESEKKNKIKISLHLFLIGVSSDNVSLDEIANLTPYSKEDLQAFNFLDGDTVDSNTNFGLLVLKELGFNNRFYKNDKRKVS